MIMKKLILLFLPLFFIVLSCEKDNGFTYAGPIDTCLLGKWKLTKIVSPKSIKIGNEIGYLETLEIGNGNIDDFEKIYKDDQLTDTYIRARSRGTDMSVKNMTVLDRYRGNKERFYKIFNWNNPEKIFLEASAYLEQVGSTQDTVKYYYSEVK